MGGGKGGWNSVNVGWGELRRARRAVAKSGGDGPLASFSRKASTFETVRLYAQTLKPL